MNPNSIEVIHPHLDVGLTFTDHSTATIPRIYQFLSFFTLLRSTNPPCCIEVYLPFDRFFVRLEFSIDIFKCFIQLLLYG